MRIDAEYRLTDDGLHTRVTASNIGASAAPYGVCPHPYLVAGPAPLDEWTLEIPAGEFLEVTPDRLLPKDTRTVEGHEFDFRAPRAIGSTEIDHAFTDIAFDGARPTAAARPACWSGTRAVRASEWPGTAPARGCRSTPPTSSRPPLIGWASQWNP